MGGREGQAAQGAIKDVFVDLDATTGCFEVHRVHQFFVSLRLRALDAAIGDGHRPALFGGRHDAFEAEHRTHAFSTYGCRRVCWTATIHMRVS
jgi:hypothetical protein